MNPEESPASADVSWPMSYKGFFPSGGPSIMRVMADHYVNVQGSTDKNSGAPPWRDTGQWTEFPCPEMCRGLWIKTLVSLPGAIRANGRSFHVQKCAGICG